MIHGSKEQCQSFLKVWKSLQSAPKRLGAHIAFDNFFPLKSWGKEREEAATEPLGAHIAFDSFSPLKPWWKGAGEAATGPQPPPPFHWSKLFLLMTNHSFDLFVKRTAIGGV